MSPATWVTLAAVLAIAGGGALSTRALRWGLGAQAVGAAALGGAGLWCVVGRAASTPFVTGAVWAFGLDPLTGFFLIVLAASAVPALLFATGYLPGTPAANIVAPLTAGFVLSLVGVLTARSAPAFLTFWELMTLLPAATILATRHQASARRSVFQYLAITHLGGVGVWVAVLLVTAHDGLDASAGMADAGRALQIVVALAAVVGFGTKAGLMPFHSWLPRTHPLAPSHVSALMSGMMIKVAIYGLIRVLFEWLGAEPLWLGVLLLGLGTLSAFGGVVYALFQHELKRLLAFHSIENVGIIVLGLGAAMLFESQGRPEWAALAFAAALFHTLNHAVFKSLLFLGAGSIDKAVHGLGLDRLGGLLRRMPWTGGAFLIGAMAIAGLPPLNGFASEWLTLQSMIHVVTGGAGADPSTRTGGHVLIAALAGGFATVGLAMTAGLAVLCFVKVIGLVLLGPPRRPQCADAREVPWPMATATAVMAAMCVGLGLTPGLVVPRLMPLLPGLPATASPTGLTVASLPGIGTVEGGLSILGTGGLPAGGMVIVVGGLFAVLLLARGRRRAAAAPVWACGQRVDPVLLWTSSGFTKPVRLIMEAVLRPERLVSVDEDRGVPQAVTHEGAVPHLFDTALYRPVKARALSAAAVARRLQSGSLRTYVLYLLALLVGALALGRWL